MWFTFYICASQNSVDLLPHETSTPMVHYEDAPLGVGPLNIVGGGDESEAHRWPNMAVVYSGRYTGCSFFSHIYFLNNFKTTEQLLTKFYLRTLGIIGGLSTKFYLNQ